MNILIPFCFLFSLISYVNSRFYRKSLKIFQVFFAFLFLLLAIRYKFGPDYTSYWEIYNAVNGVYLEGYTGQGSSLEPAFLVYLQLFPNYTLFVASISLLWLSSSFYIYSKYANYKYFWFIMIFMILDPNSITGASVAMRTTLSSIFFIIGFVLLNRDSKFAVVHYVICIFIASMFHTSSLLFLPFFVLKFDKKDLFYDKRFMSFFCVLAVASVIIGYNPLISSASDLILSSVEEFQRYEAYDAFGVVSSFNALIFKLMNVALLFFVLNSARRDNDEKYKLLYKFSIISLLVSLILGQNILSDRMLTYLAPIYMSAITRCSFFNLKRITSIALFFIFAISSYLLYSKMSKDYAAPFLTYQSIFNAPIIP